MARALFDLKKYAEVIEQIRWVVQEAPDNLIAQRLMAEASLMIGNVQEALQSYKMLLYFSPGDGETAHLIQELESQAYREGSLVLSADFKEKKAGEAIASDPAAHRDGWVKKIEILQQILAKTEHYRTLYRLA